MSSTNATLAKVAVIDSLAALSGPAGPLAGVQVTYRYAAPSRRAVYLGGVTFSHGPGVTASERDTLDLETATVSLYVRIVMTAGDDDVRKADADAYGIAEVIHQALSEQSKLPGADNMHYVGIEGGTLDYALTDDEAIVALALHLTVASYV